jgi:hypothetical protein
MKPVAVRETATEESSVTGGGALKLPPSSQSTARNIHG